MCCFYLVLAFWLIVAIPTFVMPRWGHPVYRPVLGRASSIFLMRLICNTKVEYRGFGEDFPKGPLIVASKHQSMWEKTFAAAAVSSSKPLFIVKRELKVDFPFFGWYPDQEPAWIGVERNARPPLASRK